MNIITSSTILSWVAEENPSIIPVLARLGITEGLGEMSVRELCQKSTTNEESLILIINLYLNRDYSPYIALGRSEFDFIKTYFDSTLMFYRRVQIPNIETHLNAFISKSEESPAIKMIEELFVKFKEMFLAGNRYESELLSDIKNIMIRHLTGRFNTNLYYAVIFSLHSMISDMDAHERIRKLLLENLVDSAGKREIRETIKKSPGGLSSRETDVLRLIAKGMLNKEIASELSISFNTVLSHRKNIVSKLGIKSVSGLTLYAYISGLVSSEEIQH